LIPQGYLEHPQIRIGGNRWTPPTCNRAPRSRDRHIFESVIESRRPRQLLPGGGRGWPITNRTELAILLPMARHTTSLYEKRGKRGYFSSSIVERRVPDPRGHSARRWRRSVVTGIQGTSRPRPWPGIWSPRGTYECLLPSFPRLNPPTRDNPEGPHRPLGGLARHNFPCGWRTPGPGILLVDQPGYIPRVPEGVWNPTPGSRGPWRKPASGGRSPSFSRRPRSSSGDQAH